MIGESLVAHLLADNDVRAITTQIYPQGDVPQSAEDTTRITYTIDEDAETPVIDGFSGLKEALVSVDAWSPRLLTARQLAGAITESLRGYAGVFGDHVADHIRRERYFELFESDTKLHRASMQFLVAYY